MLEKDDENCLANFLLEIGGHICLACGPGTFDGVGSGRMPGRVGGRGNRRFFRRVVAGNDTQIKREHRNGHLLLEVRPRYALISETVRPEKTDVWTVRTTLGWQTAPYRDLRFTAQYIYTGILGPARLNAIPAQSFSSKYPLLPDPAQSGINQIFADYTGVPSTRLRIDNERFISDVDFRQTPQVFDGVTLINSALPET